MNRLKFLKSISSLTAGIAAVSMTSFAKKPEPEPESTVIPKSEDVLCQSPPSKELPFVTNSRYIQGEYNGIDGMYVFIPLSEPFSKYDIITNDIRQFKFYVVDEPILFKSSVDENGFYEEYWLHKTTLITNNSITYYPRKWLLPGTQFVKIQNALIS